jgi:hypothetical protein
MKDEDDTVPLKRVHVVDGIVFIRIDDSIIRKLSLDTGEVWVEQCIVENGILLVIRRKTVRDV